MLYSMGKYSSSGRKHTKIVRSSATKHENVKLINTNHEINRRGTFGEDEEDLIIRLHSLLGDRWSLIAGRLPGRTADEVKNHWESHITTKAKNLTITCACCNKKPQHHPPNIYISNYNIINKSSSSSASRKDHRRPIRKSSEYYHALDPTAPDDDGDGGGEIDLSLKIGLPSSTTSSHRFIRTVADQEEEKKMMLMKEVIARDVEAAQINDYETPALMLFR